VYYRVSTELSACKNIDMERAKSMGRLRTRLRH